MFLDWAQLEWGPSENTWMYNFQPHTVRSSDELPELIVPYSSSCGTRDSGVQFPDDGESGDRMWHMGATMFVECQEEAGDHEESARLSHQCAICASLLQGSSAGSCFRGLHRPIQF